MTLASAIVQAAYRENNLIPVGTQPTATELSEALERLNRYVQGLYGFELGENLADWQAPSPQRTAPVSANYPQLPFPTNLDFAVYPVPVGNDPNSTVYLYPPPNSRVIWGGVTLKLFFPEAPDDGARMGLVQGSGAGDGGVAGSALTLDGNGRTIGGSTQQTLTGPVAPQQWLYRADLGNWSPVVDMALTDQMPFPSEIDDLWINMLAIRLAPRYGKSVAAETQQIVTKMMAQVKARYRQRGTTVYGSYDFPNSRQSYATGQWWW